MVMAVIFVAILKEGHSPWDIIMHKVMHVINITTKNVVYRGTGQCPTKTKDYLPVKSYIKFITYTVCHVIYLNIA